MPTKSKKPTTAKSSANSRNPFSRLVQKISASRNAKLLVVFLLVFASVGVWKLYDTYAAKAKYLCSSYPAGCTNYQVGGTYSVRQTYYVGSGGGASGMGLVDTATHSVGTVALPATTAPCIVPFGARFKILGGPFNGKTVVVTDRIGHSSDFDVYASKGSSANIQVQYLDNGGKKPNPNASYCKNNPNVGKPVTATPTPTPTAPVASSAPVITVNASCSGVSGTAYDVDSPNGSVSVDIYINSEYNARTHPQPDFRTQTWPKSASQYNSQKNLWGINSQVPRGQSRTYYAYVLGKDRNGNRDNNSYALVKSNTVRC